VASLSQGRTAAAQCGLFTHKSVPVIFEPPCIIITRLLYFVQSTIGGVYENGNDTLHARNFVTRYAAISFCRIVLHARF